MRALLPFPVVAVLLGGCNGDPPWCEARAPLSLPCAGARCVAAVMVDYARLEPRGYLVRDLTGSTPLSSAKAAETRAVDYLKSTLKAKAPDAVDSDLAGAFYNCFLAYAPPDGALGSDSWLLTVHAKTGDVVFSGLEIWANPKRGFDYPLPPGWRNSAALGCTDGADEPASKALRTTGFPLTSPPASTAVEAWEVARRLNLTEEFAAGKPYRVMVVSYAPAIGDFDLKSTDWLIWLTRD